MSVMRTRVLAAALMLSLAAPGAAAAQAVSAEERDALVALHVRRGGRPSDLDEALWLANEAAARGLPVRPITDKIREGVSKRAAPARITLVVRALTVDLETADRLTREWAADPAGPTREAAVTLLADALGDGAAPEEARLGVTIEEVRELGRLLRGAEGPAAPPDVLAHAAKGLAFIKDAKLPVMEGMALVGDAAHRGYRAYDLLDLGRQIKRRERDYQAGRATLAALRQAIARGERLDQLFRNHPITLERPASRPADVRPPTRPDRPERPERIERPQRPERVGRP
jgi:hypothetical protein